MPKYRPYKYNVKTGVMTYKRKRNRKARIPRGMSLVPTSQKPGYKGHPFGEKFYTKLRYNEAHRFAAQGNLNFATSYKYRLNGIYDPNFTGIGHQPMGYDELSSIYKKATVVGARITVAFITDSTEPCVCGIRVIEGTEAAIVDKKKAIENGDSKWRYMNTNDGGRNIQKFSKRVNVKKHFGLANIVGNDDFTLGINQNPATDVQLLAELWVAPVDPAQAHGAVLADITIEYAVVFTEPKDLALS